MVAAIWPEVETFCQRIEQLPDNLIFEDFTDGKYGIYFRNLIGIVEHTHYHAGQIALIRKILKQKANA